VALGASAYFGSDLPPHDPRVLQGSPFPRCGLGHHRPAPRAGHAQDGRIAEAHALDLRHGPDRRDRERGRAGFAGFFSKDAIIEAVQLSKTPGAGFAWLAVTACVFVTAFYTFRLVFYAFHGKERFGPHDHAPHESPAVVTVPLVLLAIPSICAGWLIGPVLFGGYFGGIDFDCVFAHRAARNGRGIPRRAADDGARGQAIPFWLTAEGSRRRVPLHLQARVHVKLRQKAGVLVTILEEKYGFDRFYDWFFAGGARRFGNGLWRFGDVTVIDGLMVERLKGRLAGMERSMDHLQPTRISD